MAPAAASKNNLRATVRAKTGKGASRQARREGQVPAVLYGHGTDPRHLLLPARELAAVLRYSGTNAVLALDIDGTEQLALTRALEIHPIRRNIQHADLLVVKRGEKVIVEVNVLIEGEAAPGTLVTQEASTIEIEAEALSIPEELIASIEGAEVGTQILASDVPLPDGVSLISDPEFLVVNIVPAPTAQDLEGGIEEEGEEAAEAAPAAEAPESE
ncbi:50S ribosomal protein L25 [Mycolicibacterium chitae]|uniref:Large ribosomal subunit protein bL25 n=1 Tax=Mycolicibacterium chitae TaxID=1792 RepID=A0A3S4RK58_MYCCI|nr:50S ribosomal protein L25/general stress protein Ctc [Mycolicibacterium chitae]MCV7106709.1 50S ribosomal protein L25/general stress protein Ctc [Mycolicibacterium chitae]BBZ02972.1 50S ribosomal protein L25 [Mycolicibacterium chitae]VEG46054.1 50S ribosomal protein L25/general stress protein Ctc [Mycolicibacterium chitae]